MKQSFFRGQQFSNQSNNYGILWNMKFHYRGHKSRTRPYPEPHQSSPQLSHLISLRSISILSSHLHPRPRNSLCPSGFPTKTLCSTQSAFVTLLSQRTQSGSLSCFGKRVWLTVSHIVSIISFLLVLFTQFIVGKIKKMACSIKLNN